MGFLGYDSDRLGILKHALERACADLVAAHVTADPMDAFDNVTSSIRSMTTWSQRIRSLIANPAMTTAALGPAPFHLDIDLLFALPTLGPTMRGHYGTGQIAGDDIANALLYERQQQGWTIATDPTPDVALTPDEQSMADSALATRLRTGDPNVVFGGSNGQVVRTHIEDIANDPGRSSNFVAALGDEGLTKLSDYDARQWFDAHPQGLGTNPERQQADTDIQTLARVIDHSRTSPSDPLPKAFDTMDPEAEAILLSRLDVDAATLGSYSAAILQRWHTDPPDGHGPWIVSTAETTIGPGSFLFPRMSAVPGASATFVGSAVAMDDAMRLMVLYGSVDSEVDYEAVMRQSTDPAYLSVSQAKAILLTVLDDYQTLDGSSVSTDHRSDTSILGAISVPWLMELCNIDPGFGVTSEAGAALVAFVFHDEESRKALMNGATTIANDIYDPLAPPTDWGAFMLRLAAMQRLHGMLDKTALKQELADEEQSDLGVAFWLTISQKIATYTVGAMTAGAMGSVINVAVSRVQTFLAGTLPSDGPAAAIDTSAAGVDARRNAETYLLMHSCFIAAVGYGAGAGSPVATQLPREPPEPPDDETGERCSAIDYAESLDTWIAGLPDGDLKTKMSDVRRVLLNDYTNGFNCA